MGIQVVRARVYVTLPIIVCSGCGANGVSQPIGIEVTRGTPLADLVTRLATVRLGTEFPVGWAKFYRKDGDILKCPSCVRS